MQKEATNAFHPETKIPVSSPTHYPLTDLGKPRLQLILTELSLYSIKLVFKVTPISMHLFAFVQGL